MFNAPSPSSSPPPIAPLSRFAAADPSGAAPRTARRAATPRGTGSPRRSTSSTTASSCSSTARIVHINDAARVELDDRHPLQLLGDELRARFARDVAPLHEAVGAASLRGMRRLLTLGKDAERASVSVVPLEAAGEAPRAVLVVLGKRTVCESLSVQGFARSYGLTAAETRVLVALCNGIPPAQAAVALRRRDLDHPQPDRQHAAEDRRGEHPRPGAPGRGVAAGEGGAAPQRLRAQLVPEAAPRDALTR